MDTTVGCMLLFLFEESEESKIERSRFVWNNIIKWKVQYIVANHFSEL
jgi:hypothetical protein